MSTARSIYGARSSGRTIYGGVPDDVCDAKNVCLTTDLLSAFYEMTTTIRSVVEQLFPAAHATSAYIANMSAIGGIPPAYFVRLAWRQMYPGETFTGTPVQVLQLEDIYLQYDLVIDPTKDKLFAT